MSRRIENNPEVCHGLGRYLKVLAATGITLHVFVLLVFCAILAQIWHMLTPMDPVFQRLTSATESQGVDSGDDVGALRELHVRLQDMAASSSDAKAAQFVHVVFVEFDEADPAEPNRLSMFGKETSVAALDVSGLKEGAAVLIADRQVIWRIEGAGEDDFAKIGFEGPYVFDLAGAHPGLLAAFRVEAFGSRETSRPRDYDSLNRDQSSKHRFCATVARWRQYFDVPDSQVRTWHVTSPQHLSVNRDGPSSGPMGQIRSRRYENYCRS